MPRIVNERSDALAALREIFREYGFEGASLSLIGARTGLGKGSLYHFFPGGKDQMAAAVLDDIDAWFEQQMFQPLRDGIDAPNAIRGMFQTVDDYFRSGERICLVGAFALGDVRDRFAVQINGYFVDWRDALASALRRTGKDRNSAKAHAEETVAGIQGALVMARAQNDTRVFSRLLKCLEHRLEL
jgi:AcrR family transcriptional regulator